MKMIRKATTSTEDCDVPFSWDTYERDIDPNFRHHGKSFIFAINERNFLPSPGSCLSIMFSASQQWVSQGAFKKSQSCSYWNKSLGHGRTVKYLVAQENCNER